MTNPHLATSDAADAGSQLPVPADAVLAAAVVETPPSGVPAVSRTRTAWSAMRNSSESTCRGSRICCRVLDRMA